MPVRDKAVDRALRSLLGDTHMSFNNVHWTAQIGDEVMTRDEFTRRYWDPIDAAYEAVVDSIDWNRVMLEAMNRHITLGHDDEDRNSFPRTEDICPECLCEALLAESTHVSWKREPKVTRIRDRDED